MVSIPDVTPPLSTRQRRKQARPQELLHAALALFVEKGFAATRAEEVARQAGVSKGTLYLYYPSKEHLLMAVIAHYLSSEIRQGTLDLQAQDPSEVPTPILLKSLLVPWWTRVLESPASAVIKLVVTEVRNFPDIAQFYAQQVVEPGQALISRLIERGVARGEFPPQRDSVAVVHSLVLPLVMLCVHRHSLGACTLTDLSLRPSAFIESHIDLVLAGLRVGVGAETRAPRLSEESSA
jgi:AcrR family transcriptional regulator